MSAGAQPDYDALAKQHGAVLPPPATVDYDALAQQHGAVSSVPGGGTVEQPGTFDRIWNQTFLRKLGSTAGEISDWAARKAEQHRQENLAAAAKGKEPPHSEVTNSLLGMLSSYGKLGQGATDPKNLALIGALAAANTNPVTAIPADVAVMAHGGFGTYKAGMEAAKHGFTPENVESGLYSLAELAGGAAGTAGAAPGFRAKVSPTATVQQALSRKIAPVEADVPRAGGQIQPALNNTPREVLEHAAQEKIQLTPGQATEDAMAQNLQKAGTTAAVGGKELTAALREQQATFGRAVNNFMEDVDPKRMGLSTEQAGESIQQTAKVAMGVRHENSTAAYAQAAVDQADLSGNVLSLKTFADSKLNVRQPHAAATRAEYQSPAVKAALDDIGGAPERLGKNPSIQSMRNLRTEFWEKGNDYSGNIPDSARALYKQAAGLTDDAMMNAAKGRPFEQSFRDASDQWKDLQQKYNEPGTSLYKILQQKDPTKIVSMLQNAPATDIETLRAETAIRDAKGKITSDGPALESLKRTVVNDIANSRFRVGHDGLGGYSDGYLKTLFGADQVKELYLKADLAHRLNFDPNPSGTGANISSVSQLGLWNQTKMSAAAKMSMPRDPLSYLPPKAAPAAASPFPSAASSASGGLIAMTSPITGAPLASPAQLFKKANP